MMIAIAKAILVVFAVSLGASSQRCADKNDKIGERSNYWFGVVLGIVAAFMTK